MRARFLFAVLLTASCTSPPPDAYFGGSAASSSSTGVALGADAMGEACTLQPGSGSGAVFCGTWQQPSGEIARSGAATPTDLLGLATGGTWRSALDFRLVCGPPQTTTILGGVPAVLMQCTRKIGGWPQVALVAAVDGTAWQADSILPAMPVLERGIGVLAGRITPQGAPSMPAGAAAGLVAARLAAQSFSAGDVGRYDTLMAAGTRANLAQSFAAAEQAFRAALAVQRKALGVNDPNTANAEMHLALQVSNDGRYPEADGLFAQAGQRAPRAADPTVPARLLHYRALHALNQGKLEEALALLRQSEAAYAALLPASALAAQPPAQTRLAAAGGGPDLPTLGPELLLDPAQRNALIGVEETRRYQAIVLRDLKRPEEAAAAIASAERLAAANRMSDPILTSRLYRTRATAVGAAGDLTAAISDLSRSSVAFDQAQPDTRPVAETALLRAANLQRAGDGPGAIGFCLQALALLRRIESGVAPGLIEPCLGIYAAQADKASAGERQTLVAEMFETAQLAQGGVTRRQIAEAAARLAENAKDPRVGTAIRRRQDAGQRLSGLLADRDMLAAPARGELAGDVTPLPSAADLDKQIAAARAELADADAALQVAAPNYGQLVQQVVPAAAVLKALGPHEAFLGITLTGDESWAFLLRNGEVRVARSSGGLDAIEALVSRLRASIEPGARGLPRFDVDAARRLYADTLGPFDAELAGTSALVVAPTGPLLAIPFAVLLTGSADADHLGAAPWLVRRLAITHVPSAANFVALRAIASGSRAARPWFGSGDFRPVTLAQAKASFPGSACADSAQLFAGLPPLPFAARELALARGTLGGAPGDELLGTGFTVRAVQAVDLTEYRVLHFAAHALLPTDLKCESEPALVTSAPAGAKDASGALLTASKVSGLKLDADAVILSACNSAGPGGAAGESLSGLARAFFYAGARTLLVTHWSVSDQAAAFLVVQTLEGYRAGKPIAEALREAELTMLDRAGRNGLPRELAHPFLWAPFAAVGEGSGGVARTAAATSVRTGG
jgi:CHAT domain-containing protein/tetratricopeptide (TPR) repeat protein